MSSISNIFTNFLTWTGLKEQEPKRFRWWHNSSWMKEVSPEIIDKAIVEAKNKGARYLVVIEDLDKMPEQKYGFWSCFTEDEVEIDLNRAYDAFSYAIVDVVDLKALRR